MATHVSYKGIDRSEKEACTELFHCIGSVFPFGLLHRICSSIWISSLTIFNFQIIFGFLGPNFIINMYMCRTHFIIANAFDQDVAVTRFVY